MDAEGNFITAWINHNIRSNIVEYKRYNAAGKAQGLMQRANAISMKLPFAASIAADPMGGFVIVWAERDGDSSEPAQVWVQRYSRAGTALGAPLAANSPTADLVQAPSVGVQPGGGFVVALTEPEEPRVGKECASSWRT